MRGKELLIREYKENISEKKNKDQYHAIHPKSLQMDGLILSNENPLKQSNQNDIGIDAVIS